MIDPSGHNVGVNYGANDLVHVAEILAHNSNLKTLKLRTTDDLKPIARVLKTNTTLTCLEITDYDASDLHDLALSLEVNRGLTEFIFYQNQRSLADFEDIVHIFKCANRKPDLRRLTVSRWLHEDEYEEESDQVWAISQILQDNLSLDYLDFGLDQEYMTLSDGDWTESNEDDNELSEDDDEQRWYSALRIIATMLARNRKTQLTGDHEELIG